MTGPHHIADELDAMMFGIGMRAIGYHMAQARRLNGSSRFRTHGRSHVREAVGIYLSMKARGLLSGFQGGSTSAANGEREPFRVAS